jgi:type IV pilus assembly protein PilB
MADKKKGQSKSGGRNRKKLGDLLVEAGLIDLPTLLKALDLQKSKKKRIGQLLIDMGVADDIEIAKALSTQLKIPFIRLKGKRINEPVIAMVPADMAENYLLIPLKEVDGSLVVAMSNPLEFYALDDLRFVTQKPIRIAVSPENDILDAIGRHYPKRGLEAEFGADSESDEKIEIVRRVDPDEKDLAKLMSIAELPPVVRFTNSVFVDAIKLKASDIHVEPQKNAVVIRYRIDGIMREIMQTDKHVHSSLVSRIKVLSDMDISVRRRPQDGRAQVRYEDKAFDMRVSSIPTSYGEKITIRILNPDAAKLPLEAIGLQKTSLALLEKALGRPQGIMLVTGPTGSGKSSTLYSCLNRLNSPEVNIITVEDPVEFDVDGINQVNISPKAGITFAAGLRSILRQDPDIVMVGEIRDSETAGIAGEAAQTGHLVLSTLHTNNAPAAVTRMMDLGVDAFILSDSLLITVAQRLVRKICDACKVPDPLSPRFLQQLPSDIAAARNVVFYKGQGCDACRFTGYTGRLGVFEVLDVTPAIQEGIALRKSALELKQVAAGEGFQSLFMDGIAKAIQGLTSVEEIFRVAPPRGDESGELLFREESVEMDDIEDEESAEMGVPIAVSTVKPRKILVVDDNELMRQLIVHALKSENFLTIEAGNGMDAMKKAFEEKPDLIITDYIMPEMDGMVLLKKLKAELSTRLIPVIMVTAKDEVDSEVAVLEAGADDYLAKPIDAKRMVARVKKVLYRNAESEGA